MNAKVEAVIDGFSNTGIHADYVHTVKMPDNTDIHVIHVENGSFTQGGVILGVLSDNGFNADLQNYGIENVGETAVKDADFYRISLEV